MPLLSFSLLRLAANTSDMHLFAATGLYLFGAIVIGLTVFGDWEGLPRRFISLHLGSATVWISFRVHGHIIIKNNKSINRSIVYNMQIYPYYNIPTP